MLAYHPLEANHGPGTSVDPFSRSILCCLEIIDQYVITSSLTVVTGELPEFENL